MMTREEAIIFKGKDLVGFYEKVEALDFWDFVEPEEYAKFLELVGLDYYSYDDPDLMWDDYEKILKEFKLI